MALKIKMARWRSIDEDGNVLREGTYFPADRQNWCCRDFQRVLDDNDGVIFRLDERSGKIILQYHYREIDAVIKYCPFCGERLEFVGPTYTKETRRFIKKMVPEYGWKEVRIVHDTGEEEILWSEEGEN